MKRQPQCNGHRQVPRSLMLADGTSTDTFYLVACTNVATFTDRYVGQGWGANYCAEHATIGAHKIDD